MLNLPMSMTHDQAQAVLLLAWLVFDDQASVFAPNLCDFQSSPWAHRRQAVEAYSAVDNSGDVGRLQPAFAWSELVLQVEIAIEKCDAVMGVEDKAMTTFTTTPSERSVSASCASLRPDDLAPQREWQSRRAGGLPCRGWAKICGALGEKNTRSRRGSLKRLNESTSGPIRWCGNTPEVDSGELLAWIGDTAGRAKAMADQRVEKSMAAEDLGERDGAKAQDYKAQVKKPHGWRGKAKG